MHANVKEQYFETIHLVTFKWVKWLKNENKNQEKLSNIHNQEESIGIKEV